MMENEKKKEFNTEELILSAAKEVFYKKGLAGSRMQEIADLAGINKALLHYYFRTKEKLFFEILKQTAGDFFPRIVHLWHTDEIFEIKLRNFIHSYIDFLILNRHLPQFIINVMYQNPEQILSVMRLKDIVKMSNLQSHIDMEASTGRIQKVDAYHLMITIISLCVFPVMAEPIIKLSFDLDDENYQSLLIERKNLVPEIIMNWLQNKSDNKIKKEL